MTRRIAHHFAAAQAPEEMRAAAAPYQERFGTEFATLTYFSRVLLEVLQAHDGPGDLPADLRVASAHDPTVVQDLAVATAVANQPAQTVADRTAYRDALLRIYHKLPVDAAQLAAGDVLCVGPEREGRLLAAALGCLPEGRSITPSAKRISYDGGILVGMSEVPTTTPVRPSVFRPSTFRPSTFRPSPLRHCLVVDGVVASGATVMALLHALPETIERVTLLTAQSTAAGVWAIRRYATLLELDCELVVGHVSGVLNDRFYATDELDPDRLVLGDVGDTISGLPERAAAYDASGAQEAR